MKPYCEVMVQNVFPVVRAMIAKELMMELNHTQVETAKLMGVTQPAISQYKRELRGTRIQILSNNEEVNGLIKKTASHLAKQPEEAGSDPKILCEICKEVRKEGLLCKLHIEVDPKMRGCTWCINGGCEELD